MTRRVPNLPETLVRKHLQEVFDACQESNTRPNDLMLARRLDLANTTFRRRYSEITREISEHRAAPTTPTSGPTEYDKLVARNAKLRRRNRDLTTQLAWCSPYAVGATRRRWSPTSARRRAGRWSHRPVPVGSGTGWLVDPQTYTDRCEPGPVRERTQLRIALDRVLTGRADGLLVPAFEHISPDLKEYGDQLHQVRAYDRFIALVLPEIPRGTPGGPHGWTATHGVLGAEPDSAGA
ncbi:hypothetical protein [Streptomyces sp. NBC_01207]|uniref:hypothetical protein n=1 Tax=Streptomyces sp. NBC_01207 TaxID=2903772 RepID=UPI002E105D29|nr:hypothetical protein OG457_00180 [Streptomyces sp. NBC_01207]